MKRLVVALMGLTGMLMTLDASAQTVEITNSETCPMRVTIWIAPSCTAPSATPHNLIMPASTGPITYTGPGGFVQEIYINDASGTAIEVLNAPCTMGIGNTISSSGTGGIFCAGFSTFANLTKVTAGEDYILEITH